MLGLYTHHVPLYKKPCAPNAPTMWDWNTPVREFDAGSLQSRRTTLADTEGYLTHARELTPHIEEGKAIRCHHVVMQKLDNVMTSGSFCNLLQEGKPIVLTEKNSTSATVTPRLYKREQVIADKEKNQATPHPIAAYNAATQTLAARLAAAHERNL